MVFLGSSFLLVSPTRPIVNTSLPLHSHFFLLPPVMPMLQPYNFLLLSTYQAHTPGSFTAERYIKTIPSAEAVRCNMKFLQKIFVSIGTPQKLGKLISLNLRFPQHLNKNIIFSWGCDNRK